MPTFHLRVLLAVTADGGQVSWLDEPALSGEWFEVVSLHPAGDPVEVEADSVEGALEVVFSAANVGGRMPQWEDTYRARDRARSLSVGDVVVVNGEAAFQVLSFGHGVLPPEGAGRVAGLIDERWWQDAARERAAESGARAIFT